MENASKALIIAGAILISILIISFGVIILGQGSQVINNADMSEAEITAYNGEFEAYEGTHVRGTNVKQLFKTVSTHNIQNSNDSSKQIKVGDGTTDEKYVKADGTVTSDADNLSTAKYFEVKCNLGGAALITSITVK